MTPAPPGGAPPEGRRAWSRPILTKYRRPEGRIEFYQVSTGVVNSISCTDPDQCTGGEGAAALPPWMIPG